MDQKRIDRISELTRICRERALTEAELAERAMLRAEYIASVRASLTDQLENIRLVDGHGDRRPLPKKQ